jgi:hypothetical protein
MPVFEARGLPEKKQCIGGEFRFELGNKFAVF